MSRFARRRAAVGVALLAVIGLAVVLLGAGHGQRRALYQVPGLVSTTLHPRHAPPLVASVARVPAFKPSAAAITAAAGLTLAQQAARLFIVALPLDTADLSTQLSGAPWGGAVFLPAAKPATDDLARSDAESAASILRNLGSRPLIGIVQPGGRLSALPADPPIAQHRQAHDPTGRASTQTAAAAATVLTHLGFHLTLAPDASVDVPAGALSARLFGADAALVAKLSTAAVRAYTAGGLIAAPGRFPGEGSASADPDQLTATVGGTLADLQSRDLLPFRALARLAPVMQMSNAAFAALDGVTPATLLPQAVALLRGALRFSGVVMSGDLDAAAQAANEPAGRAALQALAAGCDLLVISGSPAERARALQAVIRAAASQPVLASEIHNSLLRVLTLEDRFALLR